MVRRDLEQLAESWRARLERLDDDRLEAEYAFPWPEPRPARIGVAWANSELMKNVAELGDTIRLYQGLRA